MLNLFLKPGVLTGFPKPFWTRTGRIKASKGADRRQDKLLGTLPGTLSNCVNSVNPNNKQTRIYPNSTRNGFVQTLHEVRSVIEYWPIAQESPSISSESKSSHRRVVARGARATTESQCRRKPQSGRKESASFSSVAACVNDMVAVDWFELSQPLKESWPVCCFSSEHLKRQLRDITWHSYALLGSGLADQHFGCLTNTERRKARKWRKWGSKEVNRRGALVHQKKAGSAAGLWDPKGK